MIPHLRAAKGRVDKARDALLRSARWRKEYGVEALMQEHGKWDLGGFFDARGAEREVDVRACARVVVCLVVRVCCCLFFVPCASLLLYVVSA